MQKGDRSQTAMLKNKFPERGQHAAAEPKGGQARMNSQSLQREEIQSDRFLRHVMNVANHRTCGTQVRNPRHR